MYDFRSKERLKDNWQFYFLSPQMEVFKSNKTVLDNITKNPKLYTKVPFKNIKKMLDTHAFIFHKMVIAF